MNSPAPLEEGLKYNDPTSRITSMRWILFFNQLKVTLNTAIGSYVSSFKGRTGDVLSATGDYTVAQVTGAAPLASPGLTGIPTAPTAVPGTNTTQLATTAFVTASEAGFVPYTGATGDVDLGIHKISAALLHAGGATNYTETESDGTITFSGTAHIRYGSMYTDDGTATLTLTTLDTYYAMQSGLLDGGSNGFTFQNSKELKCLKAGKYLVNWSASFSLNASDQTIAGGVMINSTEVHSTENSTRAKENDVVYTLGGTGILTLAVNDLVRIAFLNYTSNGKIATVEHINLTLLNVAG